MKVGILTFPNSKSYGATLQMLALYRVCQNLGYDAEIINYHNLWMKQEKHTELSKGMGKGSAWVKKKITDMIHFRMIRGFSKFEGQMKKYPRQAFSDKALLPQIASRYDAVICGSDQVWNPDITNSDISFFLDFCGAGTARISYAPSFGVEEVNHTFGEAIKAELKKFHCISVREEVGQRLVQALTGDTPQIVIDPSLLLDAEQWRGYEKEHSKAVGDYILYYTIRGSKTLWEHCLELSRKTNMRILRIGGSIISKHTKKHDGVEYICDVSPDEWLNLVRNARYVVTNSFHGTAFSVNFKKSFYVEFSSLTNSRLSNIVNMLGLEDRVLTADTEILPSEPDFGKAEEVLPKLKTEALNFLEYALESVARENGRENA